MDLTLTEEQQTFRAELRDWLADNVPPEPLAHHLTDAGFEAHRAWEHRLFEAGYGAIHWPEEHGGKGADLMTQALFEHEYRRAGAPHRVNIQGLNLAGPTIIDFGTPEQQQRWLHRILTWEDVWAQAFSEPEAGSDLANVRTSARRAEGGFVVNGQKVWTSLGDRADWLFVLVRTDPDVPRHQGLTYVMMKTSDDGVEVRPIKQINGDSGFSEVFFTDAFVPDDNVISQPGDGWKIAMATMGHERGLGRGIPALFGGFITELRDLAREADADAEIVDRREIAQLLTRVWAFHAFFMHRLTRMTSGEDIGFAASIGKLYWSEMEAQIFDTGVRLMGERAELSPQAPMSLDPGSWHQRYWHSRAARIYAGTNEIQRNIISERVLGLPKEPRRP